jgi:hypothetical protein
LDVSASFAGQSFKHILVPVWLLSYTYGAKQFQVVLNGYTGAVAGRYPISWIKVTVAIAIAVAIVITIIALQQR